MSDMPHFVDTAHLDRSLAHVRETVEQRHRAIGASRLKGDHPRLDIIRARIVAGRADDHPHVRAAAFAEAVETARAA